MGNWEERWHELSSDPVAGEEIKSQCHGRPNLPSQVINGRTKWKERVRGKGSAVGKEIREKRNLLLR